MHFELGYQVYKVAGDIGPQKPRKDSKVTYNSLNVLYVELGIVVDTVFEDP